jgi:hypothetical protein
MRPTQLALRTVVFPAVLALVLVGAMPPATLGQALSKATVGFGNQVVSETSAARTLTFKNTLLVPVTLQSVIVTGPQANDFAATPVCALPAEIAAGKTCAVSVRFTPGALGARTASLVFTHDQPGSPLAATLTGTGVVPVTISTSTLSFGNAVLGTTSAVKTVTLKNVQAAQLTVTSLTLPSPFVRQGGSCPAGAGVLAGGASCTIGVAFAPMVAGNASAALTVSHDANNSPQMVALSGKGVAPITSSPASVSFTPRKVGMTSSPKNVTITNRTGAVLRLGAETASGDFAVSSSTCGASLAAGAQCAVGVAFTPTAVGARVGTLSISHSAFGSPLQVVLSGSGTIGLVSLAITPSNITLGLGKTQQFTATATYTDGSTADVTGGAEWLIGIPVRGRLSTEGFYQALASGANTVTARVGATEGGTTVSGARPVFSYKRTSVTKLLDGRVLIAGGTNANFITTATAELFDPATGMFTATAPMSVSRAEHTATLLPDGRVLVVGGGNHTTDHAVAEIFDPVTGTWTPTGALATTRGHHTATLIGSKVLIAAGYDGLLPLASAELYDPATGTFSPTGSLAQARWIHTATRLPDGRVLAAGGTTLGAFTPGGPLKTAEIYQPATGTWTAAGSMLDSSWKHTATLLQSGKVLVASIFKGELFDPATAAWSAAGNIPQPVETHVAALFPNGTVLLAGGSGPSATFTANFDPATNWFTPGPPMAYGRSEHAGVALDDGTVLLIGGYGTAAAGSAAAESAELRTGTIVLTGVTVTPSSTEATHPATVVFKAMGTFSDGSVADVTSLAGWGATPGSVATAGSTKGTFNTVAPGSATITATFGNYWFSAPLVVH